MTLQPAVARRSIRPGLAVFVGGLVAGILDISSAIVALYSRGWGPMRVFQSVASGALGKAAYDGGLKTAAMGLAFHFLIAFTAATIFFIASRKLRFMVERPFIWGLVYGLCVWAFMNYVVLPFSAIGHSNPPINWQALLTGVVGHPLLVGLPIAFSVKRWAP